MPCQAGRKSGKFPDPGELFPTKTLSAAANARLAALDGKRPQDCYSRQRHEPRGVVIVVNAEGNTPGGSEGGT